MKYEKLSEEDLAKALESLQTGAASDISRDQLQTALHELQVHQIELEMQNRELREAQQELEESRDRYADLYDFAPVGYLTLDEAGRILEINLTGASILGRERSFLLGNPFMRYVHRTDDARLREHLQSTFQKTEKTTTEVRLATKNGDEVHVHLQSIAALEKDRKRCRSAMTDITAKINAERELREANDRLENKVQERTAQLDASLREKEALLKEVHHRIKNNLQVIASLLNMQSKQIKDGPTAEIFRESQQRVKAMALLHEELYGSANLASIELASYLRKLTALLFKSYQGSSKQIKLEVQAEEIFLDIDRAVPCGLIVNELVSNALKYAFLPRLLAERKDVLNEIRIALQAHPHGEVAPKISDNGVGLPDGFDFRHTESLGLQLVNTFNRTASRHY